MTRTSRAHFTPDQVNRAAAWIDEAGDDLADSVRDLARKVLDARAAGTGIDVTGFDCRLMASWARA